MKDLIKEGNDTPIVMGAGFIALDMVLMLNEADVAYFAGGTCGNVIAILAHLGWESYPIARLADDPAGRIVSEDFEACSVRPDFLHLLPTSRTPIVVQRNKQDRDGNPFHTFSLKCANCGKWLPRYSAVVAKSIESVRARLPDPDVFFFDRVSRSTLDLASKVRSRGGLVFFEPSGIGEPRLFKEALGLAHIVKYASERAKGFADLIDLNPTMVQIETLGSEGLRFRTRPSFGSKATWTYLPSISTTLIDAAGAGDWCTAGIIHLSGQKGISGFEGLEIDSLAEVIRIAQAFAAWACQFEGARGGMYASGRNELAGYLKGIVKNVNCWLEITEKSIEPISPVGVKCEGCNGNLSRK